MQCLFNPGQIPQCSKPAPESTSFHFIFPRSDGEAIEDGERNRKNFQLGKRTTGIDTTPERRCQSGIPLLLTLILTYEQTASDDSLLALCNNSFRIVLLRHWFWIQRGGPKREATISPRDQQNENKRWRSTFVQTRLNQRHGLPW